MRLIIAALAVALVVSGGPGQTKPAPEGRTETPPGGVRLENLTWSEAEALLRPDAVVVIPLGVAAKEHGPHLKLGADLTLAEYLARRVVDASHVLMAPAWSYYHEPAFLEYPGSISLSLATARDLTADAVRSLARYGPRRFYVIDAESSGARALAAAARILASEGILLRYTDFDARVREASKYMAEQRGGSHADETETSMMLYIDPSSVDMKKAVKEFNPSAPGTKSSPGAGALYLTRQAGGPGVFSASGVWGDATLATREKGQAFANSLVSAILQDIEDLRGAVLPAAGPSSAPPAGAPVPRAKLGEPLMPGGCTPQDERAIRQIGDAFAYYWVNGDALRLGKLWSPEGDIVHPDGAVEHGSVVIVQNRIQLFLRREYQGTRHPLVIGNIRCLTPEIAVADGKWELRGVTDDNGQPVPTLEGLCTLVVQKSGSWLIEAYRYTIKTPTGPVPPTVLKRPGWPGIIK